MEAGTASPAVGATETEEEGTALAWAAPARELGAAAMAWAAPARESAAAAMAWVGPAPVVKEMA